MSNAIHHGRTPWLLCPVGAHVCAIPLAQIDETMRPLPIQPFDAAPPFVLGASTIRGAVVPIVDLAALFGGNAQRAERVVTLRLGERRVGIVTTGAPEIRILDNETIEVMPPLLREAAGEQVSAVAKLDGALVLLLEPMRLLSMETLGFFLKNEAHA